MRMLRHTIRLPMVLLSLWATLGFAQPPAIQPEQARPGPVLGGLDGPGFAVAFSEPSGILAAACEGGTVHYWLPPELLGVRSGEQTPHVLGGHGGPVLALGWAGGTLASAGADRRVVLRSVPEGNVRAVLSGPQGLIRALAVSPDGKTLAGAGDDGVVYLWDVESAQLRERLEGHKGWVVALAFSPDGRYLASAGFDQSVRLWNLTGPDKIPVIPIKLVSAAEAGTYPLSVAFSPDSRSVAVGGSDGQIRLYNAADGNPIRSLTGHGSSVTGLVFHPAGSVLVSGSRDRTVRLWNLGNGQTIKTLEGHTAWVQGVCLLQQGSMIASVSADRTVRLWDLRPPAK